jgi:hypothetical protein
VIERIAIAAALLWLSAPARAETEPSIVIQAEEVIATADNAIISDGTVGVDPVPSFCHVRGTDWFVAADALALLRSGGNAAFLGETRTTFGDLEDSLSNGYSADPRVGPRITLGRSLEAGYSMEASYFGLQWWTSNGAITADAEGRTTLAESPWLQADDIIGGFDDYLSSSYAARLHNMELSLLRELSNCSKHSVSVLCGLRYFDWQEDLVLQANDVFTATYEQLNTETRNHVLGAQVGARWSQKWAAVQLGAEGKATLAANWLHTRSSNLASSGAMVGDPDKFDFFDEKQSTTGVAGVLDASLYAKCQLTEHLSLRGGYQFLYVAGLALAPGQLAGARHDEDLFLHGPWLGCELSR